MLGSEAEVMKLVRNNTAFLLVSELIARTNCRFDKINKSYRQFEKILICGHSL